MNIIKKIQITEKLSEMQSEVTNIINELRPLCSTCVERDCGMEYIRLENLLDDTSIKIENLGMKLWFGPLDKKVQKMIHRIIEL